MKKWFMFFTALCSLCSALGAQNLSVRVSDIVPNGLSNDEADLIPSIQMTLIGDFSKYGRMTVPVLEDTAFSTQYTLTGTITKASGRYSFNFVIKDNSTGTVKASYGPMQCTKEELDTLKAIKAASEDLITEMGVTLTQADKNALHTVSTREAEAMNMRAKGVVAERNGDPIAAQMYFYQAVEIDPSQMQAANRASIVAATISTGNVGNDRRNDIQWRTNWVKTLTDTERYFDNFFKTFNQPYALVYMPDLQYGQTDYRTETLPISFTVDLRERSNWTDPILKTVQNVQRGLNDTGRKKDWDLNWPRSRVSNVSPFSSSYKRLEIVVELVNAQKKVIGRQTFTVRGDWDFSFDYNTGDLESLTTSTSPSKERPSRITFDRVSANDLTENLTLQFVSVNNVPVEQASRTGLLMIVPQSGYYDAAGFNDLGYDKDGYDRDGFNREGWTVDGYSRDGYDRDGINREGNDRKSYHVDNSNRTGYGKDGYNVAGYDRGGYDKDGYDRDGRNPKGLTRREVENAAKREDMWGHGYLGLFIGGAVNVQPSGGLGEFGLEVGGKWLVIDGGLGWGGGSLTVDDEMVEKKLGPIDWSNAHIFSPRFGLAIPIKFERVRLNIGGGLESLQIYVQEYQGKTTNKEGKEADSYTVKKLDTIVTPYVGARLDIAFTKRGGAMGFIGYRCEFPSANTFATYFGEPVSMRHTIFAGLEARAIFGW